MSGIAGLYYLDGRTVSQGDLRRMTGMLAHRGQTESFAVMGSAGLGLRERESMTHGAFPRRGFWGDPAYDNHIAADVRLDNRAELIATFGQESSNLSDAALILLAYERWGGDCPKQLLGDFAFAIWDGRQRVLFCARDHMGVKPFYYYLGSNLFAFASENKALFCLRDVPRRLNQVKVGDYLIPLFEDKQSTFFEDVLRLPPAHSVLVSRDTVRLEQYWSLNISSKLRLASDQEYADAYLQIFTEAVRCRLGEGARIGAFLSGGLDSSSIACLARNLLAEKGITPFPTFSAIFPDVPQCDERPFIQAVLDQGGYEPSFVRADQISPLDSIEEVLKGQGEPFYGANLFVHQAGYRMASSRGIRILLDGVDGDTTISHGLLAMADQAWGGQWRALLSNVRGVASHSGQSPLLVARKYVISPLAPTRLRKGWHWMRGRPNHLLKPNFTIKPEFVERIGLAARCDLFDQSRARPPQFESLHHYRRLTSGVIPFVLEILDRASRMEGVEPRFPFFDKRLVEFCYAIPSEQKLDKGWTRIIARRAMRDILPETVRWRKTKSNLSHNFRQGLLRYGQKTIERVIFADASAIDNYVDIDQLRRAYARFRVSKTETDALVIWKALTLALWLEQAFPSPESPIILERNYGTSVAS